MQEGGQVPPLFFMKIFHKNPKILFDKIFIYIIYIH